MRYALRFRHGGEGETVPFSCELTPMRAFMRAVGKACPTAAGPLKAEPFDEGESHGL